MLLLFVLLTILIVFILIKMRSKRRNEYIENYQFPDIILAKFTEKHKDLTDADIKLVIKELKKYFYLSSLSSDILIMPSIVLDDLWHEFILYTKEYNSFCNKAFGSFLHHSPNDTMSFDIELARFLIWEKSCKLEGLDPSSTSTSTLPCMFKIDEVLKIKDGLYYAAIKEKYWYQKYNIKSNKSNLISIEYKK